MTRTAFGALLRAHVHRIAFMLLVAMAAACGGGGSPPLYPLSGAVTGLTTDGLLLGNGSTSLSVPANAASFSFPDALVEGSKYSVTVLVQPVALTCTVTSGTGVAVAGAAAPVVSCVPLPNLWIWMAGSAAFNVSGVYGTKGTSAPANAPGSRSWGSSWTDASGNHWLFGGFGYGATLAEYGDLNDLWKFHPVDGTWTWIGGSSSKNAQGSYGTRGVASATNAPGARYLASSSTDAFGNMWLFGGCGIDANGNYDVQFSDLWKYSRETGAWTWVGGSSLKNSKGVYGTMGTPSGDNMPGARCGAGMWTDTSGDLWVFGGSGVDATGVGSLLNDLWKFSVRTSAWTWVGGSNAVLARGVYGTKGLASADSTPGARAMASAWADGSGRFWLFGGQGIDSKGSPGALSELWMYDPSTGTWTWVAGSNDVHLDSAGIYGTQGVPSTANLPGGRSGASLQLDALGNVWLFGGWGKDSRGDEMPLNDLWMHDPRTGAWTWVSGSDVYGSPGSYGTKGVPSASNVPGARNGASMWIDASGTIWLLGGSGYGTTGALFQYLNDLWKYSP